MNTLTLDIGNSSTKVDAWADDGILGRKANGQVFPGEIYDLIESLDIRGIIVSSVRKDSIELIEELKYNCHFPVIEFTNEEIRRYYDLSHYYSSVGPDRIAAVLGAKVIYGDYPKMVVDLGTAMTLDVVDDNGIFRGGNISLGLKGRLDALAKAGSLLPEVETANCRIGFGTDTHSAMGAGALNGVIGEILFSASQAKNEYDIKVTVMTGGDALKVYYFLDRHINTFYDPYLVGRGLDYHLRTHYLDAPVGGIQI